MHAIILCKMQKVFPVNESFCFSAYKYAEKCKEKKIVRKNIKNSFIFNYTSDFLSKYFVLLTFTISIVV